MRKFLPFFLFAITVAALLIFFTAKVHAEEIKITGTWVEDNEVTFAGKTVARARDFLDWSLKDYNWIYLKNVEGNNNPNPLIDFWVQLRNIVYSLLAVFLLVVAFLMIIRRGKDVTIAKFIPRFILIILLITFSFSIVQFLYQITDVIQGFFLTLDPANNIIISSKNLLAVAFDYNNFLGFRRLGSETEESTFITLLLTKATAITYYVMSGVLLLRKIILWFFLILSPIFPLLLFFYPVRNTAKIWIGEFLRWLLYAPLFAILLKGLVMLWSRGIIANNIPMKFDYGSPQSYETSVNILLGGPGQAVSYLNALNTPDSFAQYLVALIMLWVVIILPFILLHIFLDYLFSLQLNNYYPAFKQMLGGNLPFLPAGRANVPIGPSPSPSPLPSAPSSAGMARSLPFARQAVRAYDYSQIRNISNVKNVENISQITRMTNLSIPSMRDIARYETSLLSRDTSKHVEVNKMRDSLTKIANPTSVLTPVEREKYTHTKTQLIQEKQKGNPLAAGILSAATSAEEAEKQAIAGKPSIAGRPVMTTLSSVNFPVVNRVQQVSFDDYEAVKKLWQENYRNLETPKDINGIQKSREQWISDDKNLITETINLLSSSNSEQVNHGMENVSKILPFLLVGGFSQTEVIAYLKAKLEASKSVLSDLEKKQEEEDTSLNVEQKQEEKPKEMSAEAEVEEKEKGIKELLEENKETSNNSSGGIL